MDNILEIKDLDYQYEANRYILKDFNLVLKKGAFATLAGATGSGKTTLLHVILDYFNVENKKTFKNLKIEALSQNTKQTNKTVLEELTYSLKHQKLSKSEIKNKMEEIVNYFEIKELLDFPLNILSKGQKNLVALISLLIKKPDIIILDNVLITIDNKSKQKILKQLKQLNSQGTTILNMTVDLEESLYGKDILILHNGKIVLEGSKEEVLIKEQGIRKAELELPFLADLSIRLMYYGVLDHIILDRDEMIKTIWK